MTGRERVYSAIVCFSGRGYGPTVQELADAAGFRSKATVIAHLEKLRREGLIQWEPRLPRTIRVATDV